MRSGSVTVVPFFNSIVERSGFHLQSYFGQKINQLLGWKIKQLKIKKNISSDFKNLKSIGVSMGQNEWTGPVMATRTLKAKPDGLTS